MNYNSIKANTAIQIIIQTFDQIIQSKHINIGNFKLNRFADRYDRLSQINTDYHSLTVIYYIYLQIYLDLYSTEQT